MVVKVKEVAAALDVEVTSAKAAKKEAIKDHLQSSEIAAMVEHVDEIVGLNDYLQPHVATFKKYEKVKKLISEAAKNENYDAGISVVFVGNKGSIEFGPCADAREITDMNGLLGELKKKIGYPALLKLIKLNLGDLTGTHGCLTEAELGPFVGPCRGPRKLVKITKTS